jgi:hypothetical protein
MTVRNEEQDDFYLTQYSLLFFIPSMIIQSVQMDDLGIWVRFQAGAEDIPQRQSSSGVRPILEVISPG